MPNMIGILGGMGPAATADLVHKIIAATPAQCDQDHVPMVVWNVPQLPERPAAILGSGPSPLPDLLHGVRALQSVGAKAWVIACNTAHHWADPLSAEVDIPLLHIADAVLDHIAAAAGPPRRLALLATQATLVSGFYQARLSAAGVEVEVPDQAAQYALHAAIAAVKRGDLAGGRARFEPLAQALLDAGNESVLLACTELPLLLDGTTLAQHCIDATQALATACIRFSLGAAQRAAPARA